MPLGNAMNVQQNKVFFLLSGSYWAFNPPCFSKSIALGQEELKHRRRQDA